MKYTVLIALTIVLIGSVFLGLLYARNNSEAGRIAEQEMYWREHIRANGPETAYDMFARSVEDLLPLEQHSRAHPFGAALYHEVGIKGASICDERFGQGCLHEFIGLAVAEGGVAVLDELHSECKTALAPQSYFCQHGVGHGLMTYFGVTESGLKRSLQYCDTYRSEDPVNGCYTGVFMEYFERNVTIGEDSPRPLEKENVFSVCDQYSGTSRWICFYSLPRWWHQIYKHQGTPEDAIFPILMEYCNAAQEDARDICFSGLGHIIPSAMDYDVPKTIRMCKLVTQENVSLEARCRAHAANSFLLEVKTMQALRVCEGLTGQSRLFCDAYAKIVAQKTITVTAP